MYLLDTNILSEMRHNLTLVTRNIQDFHEFRVKLFNPFEN